MKIHTTLLALPFLLFSIGCEQKPGETTETPKQAMQKIAQAAGVDSFASVESLTYTFRVGNGDDLNVVRSWTWLPGSDEVTLHGETDAENVSYRREQATSGKSEELAKTDQQFVNDLYWLIFPFQVVWDPNVSVEALPDKAAAVVPDAYAGLRVRYPNGGGYTPGDVYDIFYDKDYRITHWVFRKGGSAEPTRVSEWKDYKDFGGLSISLNRPSPDGTFRIWFEDVMVKREE